MLEMNLLETMAKITPAIERKDCEEALRLLDQSLEIAPELLELPQILVARSHFLSALRRKQEAIEWADRAIALAPDRSDGYFARAGLHRQFKELKKAEDWIRQAIECEEVSSDALQLSCQIASELRDHELFGQRLSRLLAKAPACVETHCMVAEHQLRNQEYLEAEQSAHRALAADPEHFKAYLVLAHVCMHLGKSEAAVQAATSAARLQPTNKQVQHTLKKTNTLHKQSEKWDKIASVICAHGTKGALFALVALFAVAGTIFILWENWFKDQVDDRFVVIGPFLLAGLIFASIHRHLEKTKPDAEQFFIDPDY